VEFSLEAYERELGWKKL